MSDECSPKMSAGGSCPEGGGRGGGGGGSAVDTHILFYIDRFLALSVIYVPSDSCASFPQFSGAICDGDSAQSLLIDRLRYFS